jgi:hypothetical protein
MAPSGPGPYATGGPVAGPFPDSLACERRRSQRSPMPPRSCPYPARTPSLLHFGKFSHPELAVRSPHAHRKLTDLYGVKLGARAARNASTGRTLPLRAQRECQATSESITDAQSASKDGRSRRGVTGASPQKTSAALPNCAFIYPAAYRDSLIVTLAQQSLTLFEDGLRVGCQLEPTQGAFTTGE